MKTCPKCGVSRDIHMFHLSGDRGRMNICKLCRNKATRERNADRPIRCTVCGEWKSIKRVSHRRNWKCDECLQHKSCSMCGGVKHEGN